MGWLQDLIARLQPKTQTAATQKAGNMAVFVERISGADRSTFTKGRVGGTDLLIPYKLENGSVGYLGGDSFEGPFPGSANWRSPVLFRSGLDPSTNVITFDSAASVPANANGNFLTPEICINQHSANDFNAWGTEFTVIPNDAVSFSQTGRQVMSFMSINRWRNQANNNLNGVPGDWRTNYNALAYSDNGNTFTRLGGDGDNTVWWNNEQNSSPFQMMSFADGQDGFVYAYSVKSGRQRSPLMLQRVPWDRMFSKSAWQGWNNNGGTWHWGGPDECTSLFPEKYFGEPSVRRLSDGTWAMAYLTNTVNIFQGGPMGIVTRKSSNGINWGPEVVQAVGQVEQNLYGGFIHPYSTSAPNKLSLFISRWNAQAYHVQQHRGTL